MLVSVGFGVIESVQGPAQGPKDSISYTCIYHNAQGFTLGASIPGVIPQHRWPVVGDIYAHPIGLMFPIFYVGDTVPFSSMPPEYPVIRLCDEQQGESL